jgi:hypothetical protein
VRLKQFDNNFILTLEEKVAESVDPSELIAWPFLKDWIFKTHIREAKAPQNKEFLRRLGESCVSSAKVALFTVISIFACLAICLRQRCTVNKAILFSASSRLSFSGTVMSDEFGEIATAIEQSQVISLYHTSLRELLSQRFNIRCHINLLFRMIVVLIRSVKSLGLKKASVQQKFNEIAKLVSAETGHDYDNVLKVLDVYVAGTVANRFLLKLLSPKRLYVVSAYTKSDLVFAARSMGIEVVEIQHGLLAPYHPAYQYSDYIFEKGVFLPDRLIVRNEFWNKTQTRFNYAAVELSPIITHVATDLKVENGKVQIVFTGQSLGYEEIRKFILGMIVKPIMFFSFMLAIPTRNLKLFFRIWIWSKVCNLKYALLRATRQH